MSVESRNCRTCGNEMAKRIVHVERGDAHYDQFTEGITGFDANIKYSHICIECKKCVCMVNGCKSRARHVRPSTVVVKGLPGLSQNTWVCDEHQRRIRISILLTLSATAISIATVTCAILGTMTWSSKWILIALSFGPLSVGAACRLFAVGRKKRKYMLVLFGKVVKGDKYL